MVGPLLKSYQEEVDRLTTRAKHGETAFLELYKRLYEAPDPASTLASGLEKMSRLAELKAQVKKLAQELSEYRAESMEIKNQDFKVRKLEEKVRSLEAMNEEKDKLLEESMKNAEEEASIKILAEVRSREAALEEELAKAQGSVESMRRAHAIAEETVFKLQSRGEEENALAREEAEMAVEELQRAQAQLAALEAERNALLEKSKESSGSGGGGGGGGDKNANASPSDVAAATSTTGTTGVNTVDSNTANTIIMRELQKEVAASRELISCMEEEASHLRTQAAESTTTWSERCNALKVALAAKEAHVAALESQLAARPLQRQLDELKARVRLLQAVGFGATEDDEESMGGGGSGDEGGWGDEDEHEGKTPSVVVGGGGGEGSRTMKTCIIGGRRNSGGPSSSSSSLLEAALMEKCRKLEHDLTMARLAASDASAAVEAALQRAVDAEADAAAQKELVARMEEDLLLYTSTSDGNGRGSSGGGTVPNGTAADTNSFKLDRDNGNTTTNTATITSSSGLVNEDAVISALSHQRDRLRLRITELEERAAQAAQSLVEATNQATTLKADNVALVERLKYVQSYGNNTTTYSNSNGNRRGSSGGGRSSLQPSSSIDVEDGLGSARNNSSNNNNNNDDDDEGVVGKYMPEYEESVNPFSDFRAREREARRKALSVQDRAALALGKLVSGSAAARTAVFTYLMVLHMGVFFVLAGYSHKQADTLEGLEEACAKLRQFSSGNGGGGMVRGRSGDDDPVLGRLLLY